MRGCDGNVGEGGLIEWYLNEFYNIAKTKAVGTSTRPDKDSEREA